MTADGDRLNKILDHDARLQGHLWAGLMLLADVDTTLSADYDGLTPALQRLVLEVRAFLAHTSSPGVETGRGVEVPR